MNVTRAVNGKEAVEICLANSLIKIVLMDINLPLMNGYDATKMIKSHFPGLPVIAQTAYDQEDEKQNAFNAGCDGYITKPIDNHKLLTLIHTHLLK